jgi:hypothetical protein
MTQNIQQPQQPPRAPVAPEERSTYPIVEMRELHEAQRRGPFNLLSPRRGPSELLRPKEGHHVLVYKVEGRFLHDNVSLGERDELVVKASHVSVVDMRRNAPVEVAFDIASADGSTFKVVVTFGCTVTDPVQVVREGLTDPQDILLTYVKSHHNAMQMGLDFTLSQINEVRRYVDAQLTAYKTVNPPFIDGLDVQMASVEVLTPEEVAAVSATRRSRRHSHILATEELGYSSDYEGAREQKDHEIRTARQRNQHDREFDQNRYGWMTALKEQEHQERVRLVMQDEELARRSELERFRRQELREAAELIGSNPDLALHLAYAAGQLDPVELADRLHANREQARIQTQAEADKDRDERLVRDRQEHEDRMRALEALRAERLAELEAGREDTRLDRDERLVRDRQEHEDRMRALEALRAERLAELEARREDTRWEREEAQRQAALERQEAQLAMRWQREDTVEETKAAREAERQRLEANLQLLRDLAQRGHFDTLNLDLERLVTQLGGGTPAVGVGDEPRELEREGPQVTGDPGEVNGATRPGAEPGRGRHTGPESE